MKIILIVIQAFGNLSNMKRDHRFMGRWLLLTISLSLIILNLTQTSKAEARDRAFGLGVVLGWPSGIAAQLKLNQTALLNATLSYDLRDPSIGVTLDQIFLRQRPYILWFYPYFGWGVRVALNSKDNAHQSKNEWNSIRLGARLPLGVEIGRSQWRGLIELSPMLSLIPSPQLVVGGIIGIRYHF